MSSLGIVSSPTNVQISGILTAWLIAFMVVAAIGSSVEVMPALSMEFFAKSRNLDSLLLELNTNSRVG